MHRLVYGFLLMTLSLSFSQAVAKPSHTQFLIGISEIDIHTPSGILMTKIYTEAFKRMGIPVEITAVPLMRLTVMVERGEIDGEVSRVAAYSALHPELVRVPESVTDLSFAFYSNQAQPLRSLKDLARSKNKVAFRRGVGVCEKSMRGVLPNSQYEDLNSTEQGLQQLQAGRVNYFCDILETVEFYLKQEPFRHQPELKKAFDVGKSVSTFPFLNSKHKGLAPKLAAVLKQMKKEGLYEKYKKEALAESAPPEKATVDSKMGS